MSDHEEETPLAPPFGDQVPRGPRTRTRARTEEEVPALRDTLEVVEPGTEEPIRPGALVTAGDAPLVAAWPLFTLLGAIPGLHPWSAAAHCVGPHASRAQETT